MDYNQPDQQKDTRDPHDGPYIGNIWGNKMAIYGGVFILGMIAMVVYRHWRMDVPFGLDEDQPILEKSYYQQKAAEAAEARDSVPLPK